jgi:hypothetical protein
MYEILWDLASSMVMLYAVTPVSFMAVAMTNAPN